MFAGKAETSKQEGTISKLKLEIEICKGQLFSTRME